MHTYLHTYYFACFELIVDEWKKIISEEKFRTMDFISQNAPEFKSAGFNVLRISQSYKKKVSEIIGNYLKKLEHKVGPICRDLGLSSGASPGVNPSHFRVDGQCLHNDGVDSLLQAQVGRDSCR